MSGEVRGKHDLIETAQRSLCAERNKLFRKNET